MSQDIPFTRREALYALIRDNALALIELEVREKRLARLALVAEDVEGLERDGLAGPMFGFLADAYQQGALVQMELLRERQNRFLLQAVLADWGEDD